MNMIIEYFKHSELALAAYSNLTSEMDINSYIKALANNGMTSAQATEFAQKWRVVEQYNHSEPYEWVDEFGQILIGYYKNGLSATVFEEINGGKRYLAIRGTQPTDLADIIADGGILFHGLPDYSNQYQSLKTKVEQWQQSGVLSSSFTVAGHSLGGWLAGGLAADLGSSVKHAYLYNAPGVFGFAGSLISLYNQVFDTPINLSINLSQISNIRSSVGISPIAGLGEYLATVIGIQIEDQYYNNHSIIHLTDALAVYALFGGLSPTLSVEEMSNILLHSQGKLMLETAVFQLGEIFMPGNAANPDNRNELYKAIQSLQINTHFKQDLGNVQVQTLTGSSETTLISTAKEENNDGLAIRYSLYNLVPFIITGDNGLYTPHNSNGDLDTKNFSDQYFADRSMFPYIYENSK